ncbi:hypothetical protein B6N25_10870 [Sphingobacteriales bacterium TSM_CSS]|nr:hypothetical protein B6N25_10870 [Sphingobacteriales bacterium TSM_CSS]
MNKKPVIIVAPLNWGLGHATRCIPLIHELLLQNATVLLAGDGRSLTLLQQEFPQLDSLPLPSYDIVYPARGQQMPVVMARQIPKILRQIAREKEVINQMAAKCGAHAVISDNRYGCCLRGKPSVFITHQIFIQTPPALSFLSPVILWLNRLFIHRFTACWIPDFNHPHNNLSGKLAHQKPLPGQFYRFIGPLSRMKTTDIQPYKPPEFINPKIAIVLSGPEPQRTQLEELLLKQVPALTQPVVMARGITETNAMRQTGTWQIYDHLITPKLNSLLLQAEVVVARSGYSTIMDLAALGKKAVLIPTPGQTEQEYLAQRFMQQGVFYAALQNSLQLPGAIQQALQMNGLQCNKQNLLQNAVKTLIGSLI